MGRVKLITRRRQTERRSKQKETGDTISLNSKIAMGSRTRAEIEKQILFGKQIETCQSIGPVNVFCVSVPEGYVPTVIVTVETVD